MGFFWEGGGLDFILYIFWKEWEIKEKMVLISNFIMIKLKIDFFVN